MPDSSTIPANFTTDGTQIARLAVPKVDMARPAGSQIFAALKSAILHMDLAPGVIISETEIGLRFGASRTPVREALMQLRDAGLVTTLPSRGNFVTKLNAQKIREARFLREALEIASIAKLVELGLSDEVKEELTQCLVRQQAAIDGDDDHTFQAEDDLYHLTLARATGYPRVAHVLEHEKMQLDRLRVLALRDRAHLDTLHIQHCQIFDAICARDMRLAITTTQDHLRSILTVLADLTVSHSEYFD